MERTLKKGLEWRENFKPEKIRFKDLNLASKNILYQYGFDKLCQPVMYILLKNDNVENDEKGKKEKVFFHF